MEIFSDLLINPNADVKETLVYHEFYAEIQRQLAALDQILKQHKTVFDSESGNWTMAETLREVSRDLEYCVQCLDCNIDLCEYERSD